MDVVIQARKLSKEYVRAAERVIALKDVELEICRGEFLALMGPSGSGKSTLLHLIAAMDRPTNGQVVVLGKDPHSLTGRALARWRNVHIGFVFQSFNLIPVLTALENVALPLKLTSLRPKDQIDHARTALKLAGLGERLCHFPPQLSGGQEQRVAIARAIVTDPDLILLDEPTGNLDAASASEILELLAVLNNEHDKTMVMVTHDPRAALFAKTVRYLDKGVLRPPDHVPDKWSGDPMPIASKFKHTNSSQESHC